jgi:O-succinylbenzoate synthase
VSAGPVLERLSLHRVRLELAQPWASPVAAFDRRDVVLVEAVVDGVSGWGECAAQPEPTYSPEYVEGAIDVLLRHLLPRALAAASSEPAAIEAALRPVKGHAMARAAVSSAVLDAVLRLRGVRLIDHLAAASTTTGEAWRPPDSVPAGVAIGSVASAGGDPGPLVAECEQRVGEGYRRLKLKVHPGWDRVPVTAARRAVGEAVALQVDANGSYAPGGTAGGAGIDDTVAALSPLDELGLLCVEQPLGDEDLLGHAEVASRLRTPVCLDESITSPDAAATALRVGACSVVNVKPGRLGGLGAAVEVHDACRRTGVPVWCGGMLETGVGRAANLALAALPGFTLPGDLSAAARYYREDVVTEPAVLGADGTIAVPTGPGSGVTVVEDLGSRTIWSATRERAG